jgi:hypothetical protein
MATNKNIAIDQGTTFNEYVLYKDKNKNAIDLTGFTARAMMRKSYYSSNAITLTSSIVNNSTGNILLTLNYSETANIKAGRYVYDVEVFNANVVYRVQEGIVTVFPEVTK